MIRIVIICFLLVGCFPKASEFNGFRASELEILLANSDEKSWTLVQRLQNGSSSSIEACTNDKLLIFELGDDNDSVFYINNSLECNNVSDTLKGIWFIPETITDYIYTDSLGLSWNEDTSYFKIVEINTQVLEINSLSPADSLQEIFISSSN